jgi:hypothetical protein
LQAVGLQVKSDLEALPDAQDVILLLSSYPVDPVALETARHHGTRLHPIILDGDDIALPANIPSPLDLRPSNGPKFYDLLHRLRRRQGLRSSPRENWQITDWLARRWLARGHILVYTFKQVPDLADLQQYFLPDVWSSIFAWEVGTYPRLLIDLRSVGLLALVRSLIRQSFEDQVADLSGDFAMQIATVLICGMAAIVLPGRCCTGLMIRILEQDEEADLHELQTVFRLFSSYRKALKWLKAPTAIDQTR